MPQTTYEPEQFPRLWLSPEAQLTTWEQIEPHFQALLERPISSTDELETWLRDCGELSAAVSQEGVRRYVAMTCQTDDPAREQSHLEWVRQVEPKLKPFHNALREKYLDSPHRAVLAKDRYEVFDRQMQNRRDLYREANIARETALAELEQQYQKTIGAMTVTFRGREYTPAQMAPFLEEIDRNTRREAWTLVAERRLRDRDHLDDLFDQMRTLRAAVAAEAGFSRFTDYAYKLRERFDYGVADAIAFQDAIEQLVVPLAVELQQQRKHSLALDSLRPWDLNVDTLGRPPLRPFDDASVLAEKCVGVFEQVDPELGAQFAYLRDHNWLDLANRKGKAPGGYQTSFDDDRLPFIFMNAVGVDADLRTLLHEGGHAFHSLAARGETLSAYRDAPIEFCEVASMSMELLGAPALERFYSKAEADRSYRQLLEGIVLILPWIATVDAFQHWIYANPDHSRAQRRSAWSELIARFGGIVDWSGLDDAKENSWHRQLHIFLYPFYYIEYGIAQLGALQVWRNAKRDRTAAIAAYRRGLSLGGAKALSELFAAAGIRFDFSAATIAPLMDAVRAELARLAP